MTPGQLVKAVSLALDVPEETVVQHDRNLVVAGLRTTGARGRNAPSVTPLDAARLLVAVLASVRTKDSVDTVRAFEKTRFEAERTSKFFDQAILALPPSHNLIEAITALITEASLPVTNLDDHLDRFAPLIIRCHSPEVAALIGIVLGDAHYRSAKVSERRVMAYAEYYGMKQSREVFGVAIMLLGRAFREDGLNFASKKDALQDFLKSAWRASGALPRRL
jgi:hypothetical protein